MTKTVTTHKRGFFGRIWQILFWIFQAAMIGLVWVNLSATAEVGTDCAGDQACQTGVALGAGIFAAAGAGVWIIGTLILGVLMLATRGKLVTKHV